ncbi:FAD-dependent oxidoreductase [Rhodobacteraceae bacterium NNCM2]|nr:FAD-dependent oxidoreductase [Coraliihabitans acroporae]
MADRIVVIGAGQAAASLAAKLRAEGHEGPITLIGAEDAYPYQRPPLSKKYLLGEMEVERLYLRPENWYTENDVTTRLGTRVDSIDRASNDVVLEGGERVGYDKLALTTGSIPRRLPAAIGGDLDGLFTVRDLNDVDRMAPEFTEGRRVLIIGGGYIGLEAAAVAAMRGLKVTVVEMAERILQRVASPATSDFIRDLHASHGVDIREGVGLSRLEGEGRVARAILDDGSTLDIDFAIIGIGIAPDTALADAAGLDIENGIKVDEFCRTSDPQIFAAGDCASFPYRGTRIRLESVPNAIDQGENAALNMLGRDEAYIAKPWFWSDQYDCKLQIAGLNAGWDSTITRPGAREGTQSVWYYKGDDLLAVDAMNDARSYMIGKRVIEAGKSLPKADVADPDVKLKP